MFDSLTFSRKNRLPIIYQSEGAECGLACIAMVAAFHGVNIGMANLRERFGISMRGATLGQLIKIANELHLIARPLRAELEYLQEIKLPCLLHWGFAHFVVLKEIKKDQCVIHDPARGARQMSIRELSNYFTGIAVEFSPGSQLQPVEIQNKVKWRDLLGNTEGLKRSVGQILLLAFFLEMMAIASPLFLQLVADKVVISGDRQFFAMLALIFAGLLLSQYAISALRSWAILYFSTNLNLQWLSRAFSHLLRLPVDFFEKRHLGDIVSRFEAINQIQNTLSTNLMEAIIDGLMAIATFCVMWYYAPKLTAINLAVVLIYIILRAVFFRPLHQATTEAISHAAQQQSYFLETVRGIKSIKLFNRLIERRSRWHNVYVDQVNAETRAKQLNIFSRTAHDLLFGLEKILVIWLGGGAVLDGQLSLGMLVAFIAFRDQFTARISGLIDKVMEVKILSVQVARLAEILLATPEAESRQIENHVELSDVGLELKNLDFRYAPEEPYILRSCCVNFAPGDYAAIIAPSGTGKSTLAKVLLRLLPAESGEILVGGVNAARMSQESYRELFGVVLQDDELFAGSIAKNIAFFDLQQDSAWIEECAKMAGIFDEVMAMPMKFHTLVGDMGSVLSGGQKQRVLLARALYKRPKILLLDEATSHLDNANENLVNTAINNLQLTRIIIAHRQETILHAKRILRLEQGNLREISRDEYLAGQQN